MWNKTQTAILSGDSACPEDWDSDSPVPCNTCSRVWDEDEDSLQYVRGYDGEYYCNPEYSKDLCLYQGQQKSFIASVKEQVLPELIRARMTLAEIHKDHDGMLEGENCDIYEMLQDVITYAEAIKE